MSKAVWKPLPRSINFDDSDSDDSCFVIRKKQPIKKIQNSPDSSRFHVQRKKTAIQTPVTEIQMTPSSAAPEITPIVRKRTQIKETSILEDSTFEMRRPIPSPLKQKRQFDLSLMEPHDESQNYSTILKNRPTVDADNTRDACIQQAHKRLYEEAKRRNEDLQRTKYELQQKLARIERENQKELENMQEYNNDIAIELQDKTARLVKDIDIAKDQLKRAKAKLTSNDKYIELNELKLHCKKTLESFDTSAEAIDGLCRVLNFDVVTPNDFNTILATNKLSEPVGEALIEFINTSKLATSEEQNRIL